MSDQNPDMPKQENWGSRLGVVLAVAGSAVGLGNFLRFPGQAVNNGGGAFMVPYIISFVLLGIPIAWCEWTMGRMGGRFGQHSGPGAMYAITRRSSGKLLGAMMLLIPVTIYMYYILLEAWCLDYCLTFIEGGFAQMFATATAGVADHDEEVKQVVGVTGEHFSKNFGTEEHGALLKYGRMVYLVLICFVVNFAIIYQGVTRGIERFCKWAMPALILCACIILLRVLTLDNINKGLGFMWNPKWEALKEPEVWLAAAGQIFFSLSVGLGLILCYSSYLRKNDDVVLTSLSASSTNEFCEVILAGLIVVPTAFLFLDAEHAKAGTFGMGFVTVPAIMHFMYGWGSVIGAMWFGLLFLAAVTSSLSMLQPAIAFLEDGFGIKRRTSVALLAAVTAIGTLPIMYFSRGLVALDFTDFWANLIIIISATGVVLVFGWVIGAESGVRDMNRGADFSVPSWIAIMLRYITPAFLIIILVAWAYDELPKRIRGMDPQAQGKIAVEAQCHATIGLSTSVIDAIRETQELDEQRQTEIVEMITGALGPLDDTDVAGWVKATHANVRGIIEYDPNDAQDLGIRALTRQFGAPPPLGDHNDVAVATLLANTDIPAATVAATIREKYKPDDGLLADAPLAAWVTNVRKVAEQARNRAVVDANVARYVLLGVLVFLMLLYVLTDVACRGRIGRTIDEADKSGVSLEDPA